MSDLTQRIDPLPERLSVLMGVLVVATVAIPLFFQVLGAVIPALQAPGALFLPTLFVQQGIWFALTLWRLRQVGVSWGALQPYVERLSHLSTGVWWGIGLFFLNGVLVQISLLVLQLVLGSDQTLAILQNEQRAVSLILDPSSSPVLLAGLVFMAVGVAPIVEELFFRGYAYPVLKQYAPRHAMWLSALLFAAVHLYVVNFISVFVLGIVFAHLYERTGSLSVPIVAHATFNAVVAIVSVAVRAAT